MFHFQHKRAFIAGLALVSTQGVAQDMPTCRLCAPGTDSRDSVPDLPLRIEVETALDFSKVAQSGGGGGNISVDPQTGARRLGGALVDLGGMVLRGTVRITGTPRAMIRVELPSRVELRSSSGGKVELVDLVSDLPSGPRIGADGQLNFSFGGRLLIKGDVSGNFRGSIPISADYQ
ncbi:MAG: DUF4402 domain-containing protein [Chakrabartia sp.]